MCAGMTTPSDILNTDDGESGFCPDCDGDDFDGDGFCMTLGCTSKDPKPLEVPEPEPEAPGDDMYAPGEEPDIQPIFTWLLDHWCEQAPTKDDEPAYTKSELARWLGVPRQRITNWKSGAERAPWWVVMRLCGRFGFEIAVRPTGTALVQRNEEEA